MEHLTRLPEGQPIVLVDNGSADGTSAADYDYWKRDASAEECAAAYLDKNHRVGRGTVLPHDSSPQGAARAGRRPGSGRPAWPRSAGR